MNLPRPKARYDQHDEERRNQELEQADRQNWKLTGDVTFNHRLLIGDSDNADMTAGMTINQGAADDHILALKSSDVAHGRTAFAETDTFFSIQKHQHDAGGANLQVQMNDDATEETVLSFTVSGGQAGTSAGEALVLFAIEEHDGANGGANITANGKIFGIKARVSGSFQDRWYLDEDGDTWQAGGALLGGSLQLSGGAIEWPGSATLSGAGTYLSLATATSFIPSVNDGASLGQAAIGWSDLFLASGGVINFANGNVTLTHTSGTLTLGQTLAIGGHLRLTSTAEGIPSSTTQTQGQGPLTAAFNQVSVVANANDTVTLPGASAGQLCVVRNDGANTLQIFPASGAAINGLGTDNSTTLASGAQTRFWATSATQWYTW